MLAWSMAASAAGGYWLSTIARPVELRIERFERATSKWISEKRGEGAMFAAEIPQVVGGCSEQAMAAMNRALLELAEMRYEGLTHRTMDQQAARLLRGWRECRDEDPTGASSARSWTRREAKVLLNDGEVLSVQVSEAWYSGGAHCNYCSKQASFDVRSGRTLTVADVIGPGEQRALAQVVVDGLVAAGEGVWRSDDQALLDTVARFRNVAVVEEGLLFVFDPYEIAPFSAGTIRYTVPWSELSSLARRSSE